MKVRPSTFLMLASGTLLSGCAFFDPPATEKAADAPMKIVPFAQVKDSAGSAEAWYTLGRHLQRSGRLDESARAYRRALDVDPDYLEAKNGLAAVSAGKGDIDQAILILEELANTRPGQAHVLANLGYARSLKGQYQEARVALEQAVALEPDNASIRAKLDAVRVAMGEPGTMPAEPPPPEVPVAVVLADGRAVEVIVPLSPGIYELRQQGVIAVPAPAIEEARLAMVGLDAPPAKPAAQPAATAATGAAGASAVSATAAAPATSPMPPAAPTVAANSSSSANSTNTINSSTSVSVIPRTDDTALRRASERVELVNGNGVTGLARSLRALISTDWKVIRVLNHDSYSVKATRIEYAKNHYAAARQLAGELGIEAQLRPSPEPGDIHLRVVLGHDYRNIDPLRSRLSLAVAMAGE